MQFIGLKKFFAKKLKNIFFKPKLKRRLKYSLRILKNDLKHINFIKLKQ
jgi:hypothetical protein